MTDSIKDKLLEFGKSNKFQFADLSDDALKSQVTLEMLKEQDLDMYNIFGFDESTGISQDDIAQFYDDLIARL